MHIRQCVPYQLLFLGPAALKSVVLIGLIILRQSIIQKDILSLKRTQKGRKSKIMQNFCCKTFYVTLKTAVYFMHVGNGFLSPSPLSRERLFLVFYTAIFHVRFSFQCKKWPSIWWNKKFITVNQQKIEKRDHYPFMCEHFTTCGDILQK